MRYLVRRESRGIVATFRPRPASLALYGLEALFLAFMTCVYASSAEVGALGWWYRMLAALAGLGAAGAAYMLTYRERVIIDRDSVSVTRGLWPQRSKVVPTAQASFEPVTKPPFATLALTPEARVRIGEASITGLVLNWRESAEVARELNALLAQRGASRTEQAPQPDAPETGAHNDKE